MPHDVDDSIMNCLLSIQSVDDRAYVPIAGIKEVRLGRAFNQLLTCTNLPRTFSGRQQVIAYTGVSILTPFESATCVAARRNRIEWRTHTANSAAANGGYKHRPRPQTDATVASTLYTVRSIETPPRK